jgi:hypothetical protein
MDISTLTVESNTNAKLNIYRVGYTKTDQENIPVKVITIPQSLLISRINIKNTRFLPNLSLVYLSFIWMVTTKRIS